MYSLYMIYPFNCLLYSYDLYISSPELSPENQNQRTSNSTGSTDFFISSPNIFLSLFFFNLPNGTTIHSGTQSNLPNGITIYLGTQSTLSSHIQTSSTLYHLPVRHSLSVSLSPVMDTSLASILWTVALLPSTIQKQYGMNERFTSTFLS